MLNLIICVNTDMIFPLNFATDCLSFAHLQVGFWSAFATRVLMNIFFPSVFHFFLQKAHFPQTPLFFLA